MLGRRSGPITMKRSGSINAVESEVAGSGNRGAEAEARYKEQVQAFIWILRNLLNLTAVRDTRLLCEG